MQEPSLTTNHSTRQLIFTKKKNSCPVSLLNCKYLVQPLVYSRYLKTLIAWVHKWTLKALSLCIWAPYSLVCIFGRGVNQMTYIYSQTDIVSPLESVSRLSESCDGFVKTQIVRPLPSEFPIQFVCSGVWDCISKGFSDKKHILKSFRRLATQGSTVLTFYHGYYW